MVNGLFILAHIGNVPKNLKKFQSMSMKNLKK